MSGSGSQMTLTDAAKVAGGLLLQGMQLGAGLVGSMRAPTRKTCCCDIPPPCWMPQPFGRVTSRVCPGGTATVQVKVTNCGMSARAITVDATGEASGLMIDNGSFTLQALQSAVADASVTVPSGAPVGHEQQLLLWVHGCQDHFLRWTVRVATGTRDCLHQVQVQDCPDLLHHWYDHFYCLHPCEHR